MFLMHLISLIAKTLFRYSQHDYLPEETANSIFLPRRASLLFCQQLPEPNAKSL